MPNNNNNENETTEQRFKRLASYRTNEVLERIRVLGHCSNRQNYSYTKEQIDKMFNAIDKQVREIKAKFYFPKNEKFKL